MQPEQKLDKLDILSFIFNESHLYYYLFRRNSYLLGDNEETQGAKLGCVEGCSRHFSR